MIINSSGYVGIGTTSPITNLHIEGNGINVYTNSGVLANSTNDTNIEWDNVSVLIRGSIFTSNNCYANEFQVFSDCRMKKNIKPFDRSALNLINQMNIVSYDHIDFKKGSIAAGVIAQEVEEIFPECIKKIKEIIPNIFSICRHFQDVQDVQNVQNVQIMLEEEIQDVKYINLKVNKKYDGHEHNITTKIIEKRGTIIIVEKWEHYSIDDVLFVYGVEVEDFRTIDKEMISMVSIKAIQELNIENNKLKDRISILEEKINSILSKFG